MLRVMLTLEEFQKRFRLRENPYTDDTLIEEPLFDDQYLFKNFGNDFEFVKSCSVNSIWSILNPSIILSGFIPQAAGYLLSSEDFIREYLIII